MQTDLLVTDFGALNTISSYFDIVKELNKFDVAMLVLNAQVESRGQFSDGALCPELKVEQMVNCNVGQVTYFLKAMAP